MGRKWKCFLPIFHGLCFLRILRDFPHAAPVPASGASQNSFSRVLLPGRLLNQSLAKIDKSLVFARINAQISDGSMRAAQVQFLDPPRARNLRMQFRQSRPNHRTARPFGLVRFCCGTIKLLLVLALIALAAWFYFQTEFSGQLAGRIQEKANQHLSPHGLHASVGQARLIEGEGILLNNLKFGVAHRRPQPKPSTGSGLLDHINRRFESFAGDGIVGEPIAELYDAFIHLPVGMTEIVLGEAEPLGLDIRRAKLNIVRDVDGNWQLGRLLEAFRPDPNARPVPIRIHDSEIRIVDKTKNPPQTHRLTDVQIQFEPLVQNGQLLTKVTLRCVGNEIGLFDIAVFYNAQTRSYNVDASAKKIRLSPALFALLPDPIARQLTTVKAISGEVDLEARVQGILDARMPKFMVVGSVNKFALDDTRSPVPVTRASAEFLISDQQFHLKQFRGRLGEGDFEINYQQTGLLQRHDWNAFGKINHLDFRYAEQLAAVFSRGCNQFCNDFSPEGEGDLTFNLHHDGKKLTREVHADLRRTAFRFIRFPYPVDRCSGTVDWFGDTATLNLRSDIASEPMTLTGTIVNPGPAATYELNLRVDGSLPIDEKLLGAIDATPAFSRAVRPFNPIGRIGGIGKIIKHVPYGKVDKFFDIDLKGVAIRHKSFAYPIGDIKGLIKARNLDFDFENLTGDNGSATVVCNGKWNPRIGLDTHYICENVPMDDQLQTALSLDLQEIWAGFRPQGTIGLIKVGMSMPIGHTSPNVIVEAELKQRAQQAASNVSIYPTWFPYEIRQMMGNIKIGNGQILVSGISGRHGRTNLSCKGGGNYSDQSWMVKLQDLLATSVKVDDDLLVALPTQLAPPVRQMKYKGLMNVSGEITIAGFRESNTGPLINNHRQKLGYRGVSGYVHSDPTMAWDLNFAMNNAQILVGLPIENVFGEVNLIGTYDGKRAECRGEVSLDSMTIYEAQVTNVRGPIWLDNDRVSAGVLADPADAASAANNTSPLTNTYSNKRSLSGEIYGGIARFDAQMANDKRGRFYVQSTVADGDIKEAAADFASGVEKVQGRGFIAMRMGGDYANLHSYKGDGTVQLRDAKIYELPKVLTLLKMLNVGRTDRTAFDSSNVNFSINGSEIDFERIELVGDAISLIGNGQMNLEQEIALNFYSIVGRNRFHIPILSDLYHAGSQRIMWISVDGSVDDPKLSRQILPQLNDTIRQLFQPVEPRLPLLDRDAVSRTATRSFDTPFDYRR